MTHTDASSEAGPFTIDRALSVYQPGKEYLMGFYVPIREWRQVKRILGRADGRIPKLDGLVISLFSLGVGLIPALLTAVCTPGTLWRQELITAYSAALALFFVLGVILLWLSTRLSHLRRTTVQDAVASMAEVEGLYRHEPELWKALTAASPESG